MTMIAKAKGAGIFQWIALAVLIAAMFGASKRAAIPALMAIVKFFWPLLIVWLIWRFVKAKVSGAVGKFQEQIMSAAQQGGGGTTINSAGRSGNIFGNARGPGPGAGAGDVIDLCPKCGELLAANHRCK